MNYVKIYNDLISRAKSRTLTVYFERHHIVPKCVGGDDSLTNLAELTPEEHYFAHQLLVKIYPGNNSILHAAVMMTVGNGLNRGLSKNKLYGWLRRKLSQSAKSRTGTANGSYGKSWYHDPTTLEAGKFLEQDIPSGWNRGRVPERTCSVCLTPTGSSHAKFCNSCRPKKQKEVFKQTKAKSEYSDNEKIDALKSNNYNIRRALFSLGLNDSGPNYKMMRELYATVYPHATNV